MLEIGPMTTRHALKSREYATERGYILLSLMLLVALIAIAAAIAAPSIGFRVRRDREEELIHRGAQYSRSIRTFVTKTGRYPISVDELISTHYLRRRYKDPLTNKDFRFLTVADVMKATGQASAAPIVSGSAPGGLGANPGVTGTSFGASPLGNARPGDPNTQGTQIDQSAPGAGSDAASGTNGMATGVASTGTAVPVSTASGTDSQNNTVVGAQICGVVSSSKEKTIREFNHKNHYNDWLFFYHPSFDRGFQIKGPTPWTLNTQGIGGTSPPASQPGGAQTPQQQSPAQ